MKDIARLTQQLRDQINAQDLHENKFSERKDDWAKLCAALDILDDTAEALLVFEEEGWRNSIGQNYLRYYGTLQAVFLQQDAICSLHELICGAKIVNSVDSAWNNMRNLRNLSVGHPIERDRDRKKSILRCSISRTSLGTNKLELVVWNKDEQKDELQTVEFIKLYESYKSEVTPYLKTIVDCVRQPI